MAQEINVVAKFDTAQAQKNALLLSRGIQQTIDTMLGIGRAVKSAEASYNVFAKAELTAAENAKKAAEAQIAAAEKAAKAEQAAAEKAAKAKQAAAEKAAKAEQDAINRIESAKSKLGASIGRVNVAETQNIRTVRQLISQHAELAGGILKANGTITNAAGTFQRYTVAVDAGNGTVRNFSLAVDSATGEVYQLDNGVRSVSNSLDTMISKSKAFITQTIGFNGLAQSMRYAFTEMKRMSDEMVTYQKVTGATGSQLSQVRASAYSSAKAYGQSPSDFLSSVSEFARAGYKEMSSQMADLATKTQLVGDMSADMASSFLIATDAGYKFQGNVEKLSLVLDAANEIDNKYATSISKIAEGMTLTASLASQANMPIEQLMAGLGTMTAVTQRSGSEMGRALRSVMLTIMKDTTSEVEEGVTVTEDQIKSLNDALNTYASDAVKAANATGKLLNPMEALGALAKAYEDGLLNDQSLTGILSGIGGQRYSNALIALVQNWDEVYTKMLGDIASAAGSADAEVTAMTNGWTAKLNRFKTTWTEVVNDTVSEDLIKGVIDFGTGILDAAGNLENLAIIATGATATFKTLKKVISTGGFSGVVGGGWGLGVGLGITAIGAIKAAYDNYYATMQEGAEKAAQKAVDVASTVKTTTLDAVAALKELQGMDENGNGIVDNDKLEEAKALHEEIVKLIGEEAENYDLVSGKISEITQKLIAQVVAQNNARIAEIDVSTATARNNFMRQNLNNNLFHEKGTLQWGSTTLDAKKDAAFIDAFKNQLLDSEFFEVQNMASPYAGVEKITLAFEKPDEVESMMAMLEEMKTLRVWLVNSGFSDTYGSVLDSFNEAITEFETTLSPVFETIGQKNAAKASNFLFNNLGSESSFVSQSDYDKHIERLIEENKLQGELADAVREQADAYAYLYVHAQNQEDTTENASDGYTNLATSIKKATTAKKAFDEAMSTTMADGLKGYQEAFETLKKEMDEGRINSTAAHAAYRMLLGDEAYAATGGQVQLLQAAYEQAAKSYETLFATYQNEHGDVIQGGGFLKLAEQAGVNVRDASGNYRYNFTHGDLQKVSDYSKLSEEIIVSALQTLEQYDTTGKNTALFQEEGQTDTEATNENTAATKDNTEAMQGLTEALGGARKDTSIHAASDDAMLGNFTSGIEVPPVKVPVEADTEPAEDDIAKLNRKTVTVYGKLKLTSITGPGAVTTPVLSETNTNILLSYADGTEGHPGGAALVNDGVGSNAGGELIVENGRAFIANGGRPALVTLDRGSRVFSARETRSILSGGGIPAYADGVFGVGGTISGLIGSAITSGNLGFGSLSQVGGSSSSGGGGGASYKKFSDLAQLMDYIIERLNKALSEQVEAIDGQIQALRETREAADSQKELEERQEAVAQAQKDLQDAMNERTVRVLNSDGTWSWQADARDVESAKENLKDAEDALKEYQDDLSFEAQVNALEAEKERLQKEYERISSTWGEIQAAVNTPTGSLDSVLSSILKGGNSTDKTGANAVKNLLIGSLLLGGSYSGNYEEALDAIDAAAGGNPVMPGANGLDLAKLIASSGTGATDAMLTSALAARSGVLGSFGTGGNYTITQNGNTYYINGVQVGNDMLSRPFSETVRLLTVYTNTNN